MAVDSPCTLREARNRWSFHTRRMLTAEGLADFAHYRWVVRDGVPMLLGDKTHFEFRKRNGRVYAQFCGGGILTRNRLLMLEDKR